jgi:6-phosphogluconolactonase (cycloisomerase 2 family)
LTPILIGGYSPGKGDGTGIVVLDEAGQTVPPTIPADSPSWLLRHPDLPVLYAVAELDEGRVHAWALEHGVPGASLGSGETGGADPAHLAIDSSGRFLIAANYTGGSVSVHQLGPDGSIGPRTDLVQHHMHGEHLRQEKAHPHMILPVGAGLLVTDLGGDALYRYQLSEDGRLKPDGIIPTPAGSGPRHLLPAADRNYLTAELSGQVLVFDQGWEFIGAVPASTSASQNEPSELVSNGRYLYVANRGPNTVSVFALDGALPRYVTEVPVGEWPRHLALDGDVLYVANERSHQVMVLRIDPATGVPALQRTIDTPSPTRVLL